MTYLVFCVPKDMDKSNSIFESMNFEKLKSCWFSHFLQSEINIIESVSGKWIPKFGDDIPIYEIRIRYDDSYLLYLCYLQGFFDNAQIRYDYYFSSDF